MAATSVREPATPADVRAPGRGRPLDAQRDEALLAAALDLVAEVGYDRLTVDAVAARAKASKATVYRRWPDKARLVADAVAGLAARVHVFPDTGDVRADFLQALRGMACDPESSDMPVMCGVMSAAGRDAHLAEVLREIVLPVKRAACAAFVGRAIERGQLPPSAEKDLFYEVAGAMVMSQMMLSGRADDAFLLHVVDDVLLPLLTRARSETSERASSLT